MITCHMLDCDCEKQNHNVVDYDCIVSNHDYNRDYICLETSSESKQTHLHSFM